MARNSGSHRSTDPATAPRSVFPAYLIRVGLAGLVALGGLPGAVLAYVPPSDTLVFTKGTTEHSEKLKLFVVDDSLRLVKTRYKGEAALSSIERSQGLNGNFLQILAEVRRNLNDAPVFRSCSRNLDYYLVETPGRKFYCNSCLLCGDGDRGESTGPLAPAETRAIRAILHGIDLAMNTDGDGYYRENWSSTGKPRIQGRLVNGRKWGLWETWDESGRLAEETHYFDGEKHGRHAEYFPNGRVKVLKQYVRGRLEGENRQWTDEGKVQVYARFKAGKRDGLYVVCDDYGKVVMKSRFKDGECIEGDCPTPN